MTVAVCAMFGNNLVKVRVNAKCNKIKVSATKIELAETFWKPKKLQLKNFKYCQNTGEFNRWAFAEDIYFVCQHILLTKRALWKCCKEQSD